MDCSLTCARPCSPCIERRPDSDPLLSLGHVCRAEAGQRMHRHKTKWPSSKHFTSMALRCASEFLSHQDLRGGQGASPRALARSSNRVSGLQLVLRLASHLRRGAHGHRRIQGRFTVRPVSAPRFGKAKAITATARKLAVLFYNAMRHGMEYADPGASYYEERYRGERSRCQPAPALRSRWGLFSSGGGSRGSFLAESCRAAWD